MSQHRSHPAARPPPAEPIAIVGMACIFPRAGDLSAFWRNNEQGVDGITDVPPARWDARYYDPAAQQPDRFYCRRGGFVDELADFDPVQHGVMPVAAKVAEPDQLLALRVGSEALTDGGYDSRPFNRDRTGVIIGRGNYIGAGVSRLEQQVWSAEQLIHNLRQLLPDLDEEALARVKSEFQADIGGYGPDTAIGLVPNLTASRLANRLDLHGPAYTVDAACASSLVAVDLAMQDLRGRRTDMMLVGGAHLSHNVGIWSIFCQLGAMSRAQQIRPYDRRADGLLMGEGVGMVLLKRLDDAEKADDRIYAVIRGIGVASDGRASSLMNPAVQGQLGALDRAWREADCEPSTLDYLEGHGTATPTGDDAELQTLARFFGPRNGGSWGNGFRPGLGSVKSMIGHAMPAGGMAGLIRTCLALHHGVLPPTLHCEEPHSGLAKTPFRTLSQAESWPQRSVRRAGVNAFGFGGINVHAVLDSHGQAGLPARRPASRGAERPETELGADEPTERARTAVDTVPAALAERVLALTANSPRELLQQLEAHGRGEPSCSDAARCQDGPCRIAIFDPDAARLERARRIVERAKPWHGRHQIYFTPQGLVGQGGKVAFLFPGIGATFEPRVEDVAEHFGWPVPACAEKLDPRTAITKVGVGLFGVSRLLHRALGRLGIEPHALAGHSLGEWNAMVAAGCVPEADLDDFTGTLQHVTHRDTDAYFVAAGCGLQKALEAIEGLSDITVSHDNCRHQVMLCGRGDSVDLALERLRDKQVLAHKLPFQSGFHSPLFEEFMGPYRAVIRRVSMRPPVLPLWSCTTVSPYPDTGDAVRQLCEDHLLRTVRFREVIEALYRQGCRVFLQVGTGSLPGFVGDTLAGSPFLSLSANQPQHSGMDQLTRAAFALWVEGADVTLSELVNPGQPAAATAARANPANGNGRGNGSRGPTAARPATTLRLGLGTAFVNVKTPLSVAARNAPSASLAILPPDDAAAGHPVEALFRASMDDIQALSGEVVQAWQSRRPPQPVRHVEPVEALRAPAGSPAPRPRPIEKQAAVDVHKIERVLSVESCPELLDHCFFWQPEHWPYLSDRRPVAPMTLSLQLLLEAARSVVTDQVVVALEDIQAFRWLAVDEEPVHIEISVVQQSEERLNLAIEGHIRASAVLAPHYPQPPTRRSAPQGNERPTPVDAERLYADRWMFHGPAYQGITGLGPMCDEGIEGELTVPTGKGSLLDNVGQLFGYWTLATQEQNRLSMPIGVKRMSFFGPDPQEGDVLDCTVWISALEPRVVTGDMEVRRDGQVWAVIDAWTDFRLDTDTRLWSVIQHPEHHLLAEPLAPGVARLVDTKRSAPSSRDYLARRYLAEPERRDYDALEDAEKKQWLALRIVAKDAGRHWLWSVCKQPLYPGELSVGEHGQLVATLGQDSAALSERLGGMRFAADHHGDTTVVAVGETARIGVAIEPVVGKGEGAQPSAAERMLLAAAGLDAAETVACLTGARRAVASTQGLDPSRADGDDTLRVERAEPGCLQVGGIRTRFARIDNELICWTEG